jgi:2-dehydro-3-deoxygalactonokinase
MPADARLIALDWGTSNLRASLLDGDGVALDTRSSAGGVMQVADRQFEAALRALVGDWMAEQLPLIASGMVGSRQGWVEAPYVDCPASLAEVAARLVTVELGAQRLHIVPGLRVQADGSWDVMRGEETQAWGSDLAPGQWALLPGTHSKWLRMGHGGEAGRISGFRTHMTGELYGLLTKHGILGRLMAPSDGFAADAFDAGLAHGAAQHAQLAHAVFAARTAGLMDDWPATALADFLSGILIGAEVAAMRGAVGDVAPLLIGDEALCARYERALDRQGLGHARADEGATTRGQWRIAQAAGLLP